MHLLRPIPHRRLVLLAAAALFSAACDNTTEPTTPSAINATTGTAMTGRAGSTGTVTVSVTASNGKTLSNQPVTFTVGTGGGSVQPPSTQTDANGSATAVWTFGNTLGAQTLNVTSGGITQTITATVTAGLPATVAVTAGAGQSAPVGTAVATAPAVTVRDAAGNPVANVPVAFTTSPAGVVVPAQVNTDANGVARVTGWTLGTQAGTYTLQAFVLDQNIKTGNPVTITATATAGAANRVQAGPTVATTGTAGGALTGNALPAVVVLDAFNNPVANVPVTFTVASGGGTITGGTATTNAQGIATVGGFTLGQTAGANTITATTQGGGSVTLTIAGTAGTAAQTQIVSGNNLSAPAGQPLTSGPSVRVVDRFGNPVAGVPVQFLITSTTGGSLLGGTQTTNAQGIATVGGWTLSTTPGANTVVARVAGAADVTFTATGLAGAPAQLTLVSGDQQNVIAFRTAAQPLVVQVLDAAGFPVQGANVTFTAAAGAGTLTPATATTDAQGRASATYAAGGTLGQTTVTATVGNLTPVSFTITTTQNAATTATAVTPLNPTATAGGPLPTNPAVVVRDASGNPVPGVTVFWDTFGSTSGAVQNRVSVTGANGVASPGVWTLSPTPGPNTLAATVSAPGIPAIVFTATGLDIPAGTVVTLVAGSTPATAPAGSAVPVAVQVVGPNNQVLSGVTVQFQVTGGGGSINGQLTFTTQTDATGIARVPAWVLGPTGQTINTIAALVVNGPSTFISVTTQ